MTHDDHPRAQGENALYFRTTRALRGRGEKIWKGAMRVRLLIACCILVWLRRLERKINVNEPTRAINHPSKNMQSRFFFFICSVLFFFFLFSGKKTSLFVYFPRRGASWPVAALTRKLWSASFFFLSARV